MSSDLDRLRELARTMRQVAADLGLNGDSDELINAYSRRFIYLNPRVAIVGQEGAGKSTLVNALLGAPYAPTHASRPATAAPIAFRYAPGTTLKWRLHAVDGVVHEMPPEQALPLVVQFELEKTETSIETTPPPAETQLQRRLGFWSVLAWPIVILFKIIFFPFFLFRRKKPTLTPIQSKRLSLPPPPTTLRRQDIALAIADVSAQRLANGTWLLDLPGVEGADATYSARPPPDGLLDGAIVVLVLRGRSIAPGVRLMRLLSKQDVKIAAAVLNVTRDDIEEDASVSDVEGYRLAFLDACSQHNTEPPAGGIHVANLRHLAADPATFDVPVLAESHEQLRRWLDNAFQTVHASQRADIIMAGTKSERALRAQIDNRVQLLGSFTTDMSRPVHKAGPEIASAIALALSQFDDITASAVAQIAAATNRAATSHMRILNAYVQDLREGPAKQMVVWAVHFDGWRQRAHAREASEIANIREAFAKEANAAIPSIKQSLAERICQQTKHSTWPINLSTVTAFLERASIAAKTDFAAPALPSLDASLSGWSSIGARAPILAGFDQYLTFCDGDYYQRRQAEPLAAGISAFRTSLRDSFRSALEGWMVGDPAVRKAVSTQLGVLTAAEQKLNAVRAKLV